MIVKCDLRKTANNSESYRASRLRPGSPQHAIVTNTCGQLGRRAAWLVGRQPGSSVGGQLSNSAAPPVGRSATKRCSVNTRNPRIPICDPRIPGADTSPLTASRRGEVSPKDIDNKTELVPCGRNPIFRERIHGDFPGRS